MKRLLRYLWTRRFDKELDAEIQAHIDEKTELYLAGGLPLEEARLRALRDFGNRTRVAESCRERWGVMLLDETSADIRYAARVLRKSPVFAFVAVSCLALGIGVNSITFSTIDRVVLHALPYPEAERLFAIWSRAQFNGSEHMHVSAADFYDWQSQSRSFSSLAAFANWPMNLTNVDEPRKLRTELVSANFFTLLKTRPEFGRTFREGEDGAESQPQVVLSHHLWHALGEPHIGGQLTLNGSGYSIIGVMPPSFSFPAREVDAWVPLSLSAANRANRDGRWLQVVGRLNVHTTSADAHTEMELIASRLAAAYPATNKGWSVSLIPLQNQVVGKTSRILWTLQAGMLLLLVVTCANLANLLLARSASRTREIGMRISLGASRGRIVRQLLVESLVLSLAGGSLGVAIAQAGITVVRTLPESLLPRAPEISLSASVLLAAISVLMLTAVLFGIAPALHVSRMDLRSELELGGRGAPHGADRRRGLLVAVEIATAAVLLVGSGLFGASAVRLVSTPSGLRVDHLLTVQMTLPHSQYPTSSAQAVVFERVLEQVKTLPGVLAAAEISDTPLGGNNPTFEMVPERAISQSSDTPVRAGLRVVSAAYLNTAGIPLIRGRAFSPSDRAGSQPVAVVNQTLAHRVWASANVAGRRIRLKDDAGWMVIVGVVPDVKQLGLNAEEGPVLYVPYSQNTQGWMTWTTLLVRTAVKPEGLLPSVRKAIHAVDKDLPIGEVDTVEDLLSRSTAIPRFVATTAGSIAGFSLLVAAIGIYGLLAYTVARSTPEFGIRFALGASRAQITWLVLRRTIVRLMTGLSGGLALAWWLARLIEGQLFEVRAHDPAIFAGVAACLLLSASLAVIAPMRRAVSVDPSVALRAE